MANQQFNVQKPKAADSVNQFSQLSFSHFGLMDEILKVLQNDMNVHTPTPIQQLVIPPLLKGNSAMFSAQTGTGKTLTYLLPTIHMLKQ